MNSERQAALLALVRRLLPLASSDIPGYHPARFAQLCDGVTLFAILRLVLPNPSPDTSSSSKDEAAATKSLSGSMPEEDGLQRQANMRILLRIIASYAQEAMVTTSSTPLTKGLDPATLAASDDAPGSPTMKLNQQELQLMQLTGVVLTLLVLSGAPSVLREVKAMPRPEQVVLSDWVKDVMRVYELKPRRRTDARSESQPAMDSSSSTTAPGSPTTQSPQSSPFARGNSLSTSLSTFTRGTGGFLPSQPMGHRGAGVGLATAAGDEEDEGYYRNATYQLRQELAEVRTQLAAVQEAYRLSKEDKETAESKYKLLLGDQTKVSPTAAAAADEGSEGESTGGNTAKDAILQWQRRCAQKDEVIAVLTARVEQQSTQVTALKEAAAAHEMALQALRRRLKSVEEGVVVRSNERREALEKLSVAEDKLAAQMQARGELETEVEGLQARIMMLTVEQDRLRGGGNGETEPLNKSFASNGSVDHVLALEKELDEERQLRDNLQRQVGILQRQVAAMVAPAADVSTANDTWRAQLRQVQREREDLRQQLTSTLERVSELQQQSATSHAARHVEAFLSALLLQYGYRVLLLQQHSTLLYRNAIEADVAYGRQAEEHQRIVSHGPSSLLEQQRRDVEQGLLESVLLGWNTRTMRVER